MLGPGFHNMPAMLGQIIAGEDDDSMGRVSINNLGRGKKRKKPTLAEKVDEVAAKQANIEMMLMELLQGQQQAPSGMGMGMDMGQGIGAGGQQMAPQPGMGPDIFGG